MSRSIAHLRAAVAAGILCGVVACGGGGGGGSDPLYPGGTAIEVNPTRIDTGERSTVVGQLVSPNERGVVLKVRFPSANLSYVDRSSTIQVNGDEVRRDPDEKGTSSADNLYYLVWLLDEEDYGEDLNDLELKFFVRGNAPTASSSSGSTSSAATAARIEIDADLYDVGLSDQFDLNNPKFTAEDGASLEIR